MTEKSLFEKYGGFPTIQTLVKNFYRDIDAEPKLAHFFENTDMESLINHQTKFISHILGGPEEYSGRSLAQAHKSLSIDNESFNLVAKILEENLEDLGVEEKDVQTIMNIVAGARGDIVN